MFEENIPLTFHDEGGCSAIDIFFDASTGLYPGSFAGIFVLSLPSKSTIKELQGYCQSIEDPFSKPSSEILSGFFQAMAIASSQKFYSMLDTIVGNEAYTLSYASRHS